jgi:hypothetical protein
MTFESIQLQFHDTRIPSPITEFPLPTQHFGILNFTVCHSDEITNRQLHLVMNIDHSGSMNDLCNDGKTKMQHIIFTMENILKILHAHTELDISVYIQAFDDTVESIFETADLKSENIDSILECVRAICPCGSTNIEESLHTVYKHIQTKYMEDPNRNIVHIFLTDGEITMGSCDIITLKSYMSPYCDNICIGYGQTHDSYILNQLSSIKNGQYRFIDALENAGLVYGELIQNALYKLWYNVHIHCDSGLIYNYLENKWRPDLYLDNVACEQTKQIHVMTPRPEHCRIIISGTHILTNVEESFIVLPSSVSTNHSKYMLRQKTMELLYKSSHYMEDISDELNRYNYNVPEPQYTKTQLKHDLKTYHQVVMEYMKTHQLENDTFLKTLADDLYICYRTIGTHLGQMFTTARQTSQGRQQTYTCSSIDTDTVEYDDLWNTPTQSEDLFIPNYGFNTQQYNNTNYTMSDNEDDTYMAQYTVKTHISPYKTTGVLNMMSLLSQTDTDELY